MPQLKVPTAGSQLIAARARRAGAAGSGVRWEWRIKEVSDKIAMTLQQRMGLAVGMLKSKVVKNINRPVTKAKGPRGGTVVSDRSKPGEFPKADTTRLRDTIFGTVTKAGRRAVEGHVGTPLHYGLILEVKLNRSFLVRTLHEERGTLKQILTGPMR